MRFKLPIFLLAGSALLLVSARPSISKPAAPQHPASGKTAAAPRPPFAFPKAAPSKYIVVGIKNTVAGGANKLSALGEYGGNGGTFETPEFAVDGSVFTKYFNKSLNSAHAPGINSGLVLTLKSGASVVSGVQFATANDRPDRDPLQITLEGSNDPKAGAAGNKSFKLIYKGSTGLESATKRQTWGKTISFKNSVSYKSYRLLVTKPRAAKTDSVQYSEVKLISKGK